jgi:hypothetical protein
MWYARSVPRTTPLQRALERRRLSGLRDVELQPVVPALAREVVRQLVPAATERAPAAEQVGGKADRATPAVAGVLVQGAPPAVVRIDL